MKMAQVVCIAGVALLWAASAQAQRNTSATLAQAQENTTATLAALNAQIEKTPGDPMLYYRKAQTLMALGRRAEGYETAKKAMERFVAAKDELAWMIVEKVEQGPLRVDVHFNMGPLERKPPKDGIVKPLSFRVWTNDEKGGLGNLLAIYDFEIGFFDGKANTAALGMMQGRSHANFGMLEPDAKYEEIRKQALDLIAKRHPASPPAPPAK